MNPILKIFDTLIQHLRNLKDRINKTLDVAFPKTEVKYTVIVLWAALMLFIGYTIALMDIGIWTGSYSITGMIANYIESERKAFPWWLWLLIVSVATIVAYVYLVKLTSGSTGRGFSLSGSNVYGSAREINQQELREVSDIETKYSAMNTILGQLDLTEERLITAKANPNSNGNIAIFGPPGSGKSFCFVKPTILQCIRRGESCICTDTKGELWADTAEFARRHGYVVRRVDLKNPAYSDGWHVLKEMRNDDMRAMITAQIIMKNTGSEKDIHASAEEALLRAILLYVERLKTFPDKERTLYRAYQMLLNPEGAAALDAAFDAIKGDPDMRCAYEAYGSFVQGSQNLRGNIITGLANRLSILSSPPVREMTSTDDIDLTELGRRPTILYLVMSDQHETMKFMSSLIYSYAFLDLVELADAQMSRKLPVPVTFLMEEFANLGEVPNITKYLSTCRSRAINIMLVVQSLAQLREVYGDNNTDVMLAACATHLCIGYNDRSTAEYFEWRSGEASINVKTEQHQYGESPIMVGKNYSTGEGRRNYFTSHELMTIPRGEIYIVWQRYNCLKAKTFGINRHPATLMGHNPTISTEVKTRLDNRVAKDFIRKKEEERIAQYEAWVKNGGDPWKGYTKPEPDPNLNGPSRGTDLPEIIPYPELEDMALAYSEEVKASRKKKKAASTPAPAAPVPPVNPIPVIEIPESIIMNSVDDAEDILPEIVDQQAPRKEVTTSTEAPPVADHATPFDTVPEKKAPAATATENVPAPKPADPKPAQEPAEQPAQTNTATIPKEEAAPSQVKDAPAAEVKQPAGQPPAAQPVNAAHNTSSSTGDQNNQNNGATAASQGSRRAGVQPVDSPYVKRTRTQNKGNKNSRNTYPTLTPKGNGDGIAANLFQIPDNSTGQRFTERPAGALELSSTKLDSDGEE